MTLEAGTILDALKKAVIECSEPEAVAAARLALESGLDPLVAIEQGLAVGLKEVGEAFARGDVFLPDIVMSGETMKAASAILEAELKDRPPGEGRRVRTAVVGTVRNDIHDIGKSLVALLLSCSGWKVVDLGTDTSAQQFVDAVLVSQAQMVGLSSLLTTTAPEMGRTIAALKERGLREQVAVMVGGGAITQTYAEQIGADAYGVDASDAVRKANILVVAP